MTNFNLGGRLPQWSVVSLPVNPEFSLTLGLVRAVRVVPAAHRVGWVVPPAFFLRVAFPALGVAVVPALLTVFLFYF